MSADNDHSSHGLEKHVPVDWASIYVLPHLVRIVSNSSYNVQIDEIYLDHLVPTKINMYSVPNVGEFFFSITPSPTNDEDALVNVKNYFTLPRDGVV